MKQKFGITVILFSFFLAVVLAACGTQELTPCPYQTGRIQLTDSETGAFYRFRFPSGWQTAVRSGNAAILLTTPDLPDELAIRITGQEDTEENKQASQALLRRDHKTFESIYTKWGYQNFRYQTYLGTHGELVEVRYEMVVDKEDEVAHMVNYYRTDIPFYVSLVTEHPAWNVQTRAAWNWGGYGLDKVALWTLDSLEVGE